MKIPARLAASCSKSPERRAWLDSLPDMVRWVEEQWRLGLGAPFEEDLSCAWVAPAKLADGTTAVLKIGMPHMEAEQELAGLRFWDGDPTVRLLRADDELGAMLVERCLPGTALSALPEPEQDGVIAGLLRRLWRPPGEPHPFRPLSAMIEHWSRETLASMEQWQDAALVREGLCIFKELARGAAGDVLLATDLHAGNILRSEREPWLVIDPKPFTGDPAYDATQHLYNCDRMRRDPLGLIRRMAELLDLDRKRIQLWAFARAAAEPRDDWGNAEAMTLARAIAP